MNYLRKKAKKKKIKGYSQKNKKQLIRAILDTKSLSELRNYCKKNMYLKHIGKNKKQLINYIVNR